MFLSPQHYTDSALSRRMQDYVEQRLTRHVQEWRHFELWYDADDEDARFINELISSQRFQRGKVTAEFHRCVAVKAGDFQDSLKKLHNNCREFALEHLKNYIRSERMRSESARIVGSLNWCLLSRRDTQEIGKVASEVTVQMELRNESLVTEVRGRLESIIREWFSQLLQEYGSLRSPGAARGQEAFHSPPSLQRGQPRAQGGPFRMTMEEINNSRHGSNFVTPPNDANNNYDPYYDHRYHGLSSEGLGRDRHGDLNRHLFSWMHNPDDRYYSPGGNPTPFAGRNTRVPTGGGRGPAYVSPTVGGSHGGTDINLSLTGGVTGEPSIVTNTCYTDLFMADNNSRKTGDKVWYKKLDEILKSCGMSFQQTRYSAMNPLMKVPCQTDAVDALDLAFLVLGQDDKPINLTHNQRQRANEMGIPNLVASLYLDRVIQCVTATKDLVGLLSGQCPKGVPVHHQYVAILRIVYQCMDGHPIYVLFHPPSGTVFPCKNGGIIRIGNNSRRNIHTDSRDTKEKALLSLSNLLIDNPKRDNDKYGHLPVKLDIYFLWKKATKEVEPTWVRRGRVTINQAQASRDMLVDMVRAGTA